jgi:hypothetical protein
MAASDVIFTSAIIFTLAIGMFIIFFVTQTITHSLVNVAAINESTNAVNVIKGIDATNSRLDYLVFATFLALSLALIVSGYYIGGHPVFMVIYFFFIVIAVIASAILANVWEAVTTNPTFIGIATDNFPITNHLVNNLPYYMTAIGLIGILAMFAKPYNGAGE